MKILKRIVVAVLGIALLLVLGSFFLPSAWKVERAVTIQAPPAAVFPYVNSLKRWPDWTIWYEREPGIQAVYEGPEAGVGAVSRWQGKDGAGEMRILESRPDQAMRYELSFNHGEFKLQGEFLLTSDGPATLVTWKTGGDVGLNPLGRYFALLLDRWTGRDFEQSLLKLKDKLEKPG